jgi:hypothetical protein
MSRLVPSYMAANAIVVGWLLHTASIYIRPYAGHARTDPALRSFVESMHRIKSDASQLGQLRLARLAGDGQAIGNAQVVAFFPG